VLVLLVACHFLSKCAESVKTGLEENIRWKKFAARNDAATLFAPMSFQARIDQDLKEAMKAREAERLGVLRMLKAALKYASIEKGGMQFELAESDALAIVRKEMKKRQDSIESFTKGGRPELAAKEQAESEILAAYLPKAMTPDEVQALVAAAIAEAGATSKKDMGAVMKLATERAAGRVDGRSLSAAVSAALP
jgi:uncharacterized protein